MCKPDNSTIAMNTTNGGGVIIEDMKKMDDEQPTYKWVKVWLKIFYSIPPMVVPIINLSYSFSFVTALFLLASRNIGEYIMVNTFNWPGPGDEDYEATMWGRGSVSSIVHSTLLCIGLVIAFRTQKYSPSAHLSIAPQWWQNFVDSLLQFCTGYMIYDGIFNIILLRWDYGDLYPRRINFDDCLFLAHHLITSWYMSSTRIIKAGHMSAMACMFLGELSNPIHNMYMMSEHAQTVSCCNGPVGQAMHYWIEVAFAFTYNFLRVVVGPVAMIHLSYDVALSKQGRTNIPLGLRITWTAMVWIVIIGSMPWITKCNTVIFSFLHDMNILSKDDTSAEL